MELWLVQAAKSTSVSGPCEIERPNKLEMQLWMG